MTQLATPTSVCGDFDNVQITAKGRDYRLRRRNGICWAEMENPDAPVGQSPRAEVPIVMTTGSHHMQVYWYATGHTRLIGQLPLVYLRETNRWIPRNSAFLVPPDEPFSSETGRWNETCIACHTTHGQSRPDRRGGWDTRVAEFGISCEACHGPGERHVQWHREQLASEPGGSQDKSVLLPNRANRSDYALVDPSRLESQRASQVCGQCHSVTSAHNPEQLSLDLSNGYRYRPGDDLAETRFVLRDNEAGRRHLRKYLGDEVEQYLRDRFWPDGMVRVSGREYNGLMETACHQRGDLSCLSCHAMHQADDDDRPVDEWRNDQLRRGMDGDLACLQCHESEQYDERHTHHAPESSGSRCYNCHMPHTTYGLLKAIRSHQVSSPDIAADLRAGRPNACNSCHLDQTLEWSSSHVQQWYGMAAPDLDDDQRTIAASLLWLLRGDAGQRAISAWSMGWEPAQQVSGTDWQAPFLACLLDDPYDAVRFIAQRSLKTIPGYDDFRYDFVGPAAERVEARQRATSIWLQQFRQRANPLADSRLLRDPQGNLDEGLLDRLLSQRDDRPINLVE